MGRIRVLDPHVVNQIAAGEVVERPASVVKELVENALDAGATRIHVRVEDGGKALIEVADDGWGMDPEDLGLAFHPHATSKVSSVEDLQHVASLGFRGEALPSIGSVSRASIVSRPRDASTGAAVEDREGRVSDVRPSAGSPGTVVRVENLFGHVPARRKFLRTAATEVGHVADVMERVAVAFPGVGFRLAHGDRVLLDAPAGETRRARIERLHGPEVARALLEVREEEGPLGIEAYVGPPSLTRGDARLEQAYLNGRHVRDRLVAAALREAYRDLLPPGNRRAVAFLFLRCDPGRVDVNVHPAKAEVRWRDPSTVFEAVRRAVRHALESAAPGVAIPLGARGVRASTAEAVEMAFTRGVGRHAHEVVREGGAATASATATCAEHGGHEPAARAPERLRPLGQALGTYLVFEGEESVVLVDQHALHERVLFDRIHDRLNAAGRLEVQHLLVPSVVSVGAAAAARLAEEKALLETLGWVVEPFGPGTIAVRGLPAVLRRPDPEAALAEALEVIEAGRRDGLDRASLVASAVDRLACRAAVMAGDALHPDEVLSLLEQAEALNHAHSCPHGRPTRLVLSRKDLERWFHRAV
jgi:DNA mismatch repair protein MutL